MNKINKELWEIDRILEQMPEGELKIYSNHGSTRWYYSNENGREYLPRESKLFAEKLARKKYLMFKKNALLEDRENVQKRAVEMTRAKEKFQEFLNDKNYYELLPERQQAMNVPELWENQKYNSNPYYPEQLTVPCPSGNIVRSKSEVFIDMVLTQHGIP